MKSEPTNNKNTYVARDDVMKLLNNHIGDYSVHDLGWWLETKTASNFTVVELEFITQAFTTFRNIAVSMALFEKEWKTKVRSQQSSD